LWLILVAANIVIPIFHSIIRFAKLFFSYKFFKPTGTSQNQTKKNLTQSRKAQSVFPYKNKVTVQGIAKFF